MNLSRITLVALCAVLLALPGLARAKDGLLLDQPAAVVLKHGPNESVSIPGSGYRDFSVGKNEARFIVDGGPEEPQTYQLRGGRISRVALTPVPGGCQVVLSYRGEPAYSVLNAVDKTEWRPGVAQVVAGLGFAAVADGEGSYPVMGGYGKSPQRQTSDDEYGTYKMPKFPESRYSDVLVSLKVMNTDFREVLWLLSEIGNVSIILDPYWDQEPTGSPRPPGGGASGGPGGGDSGPGFRGAGGFNPISPREGTGRLSLDFKDVPFDMALDLILQAVGLVKVDIWPE